MLIQYDCYGVYKMNGIYRGDLIGVYDVTDPSQALDECICELNLGDDAYDYARSKMVKDERFSEDMNEFAYDELLNEMLDEIDCEFWVKPMTCK